MIVSSVKNNITLNFGAGKTSLNSDFDGTYMPRQYKHDAVCLQIIPFDKKEFQTHFDSFDKFMREADGKKGKFDLHLTTGRNLHEFNFYMQKIKEQGLRVPLPKSITTSNGADEFRRTSGSDYFKSSEDVPFSMKDFSQAKRNWVQRESGGFDGEKVRIMLRRLFIRPMPKVLLKDEIREELAQVINPELVDREGRSVLDKAFNKVTQPFVDKQNVRDILEDSTREYVEKSENPNFAKLRVAQSAKKIHKMIEDSRVNIIEDVQTGQTTYCYNSGMSLEGKVLGRRLLGENYVGFRDDGDLSFHLMFSKPKNALAPKDLVEGVGDLISDTDVSKVAVISPHKRSGDSRNSYGEELPTIKIVPKVTGGEKLDKYHSVKLQVDEVVSNNTNDLIVVAGDGSNDKKMLNLFNYVDAEENFDDIESLKKIKDLPVISIFVDNSQEGEKADINLKKMEKFNFDGNVRFIVVDRNNPAKPQTLEEATELAMKEYAKRNSEFAKNLPDSMKERLMKNTKKYPVDMEMVRKMEEKAGMKLYNPLPDAKFELSSAGKNLEKSAKFTKGAAGLVLFAGALGGAIAYLLDHKNKGIRE